MKTNSALSLSGALLLGAALNASAARRYHPPRPAKPAPAIVAPTPVVVDDHLRKFREVPVNTVFCFSTDRAHEWFPLIKISDTQAKSLVTAATPTATVRSLPSELVVYVSQRKDHMQFAAH